MQLPDFIYNFFEKLGTGVFSPILQGLAYIAPLLFTIMLAVSFIWLLFASRKGPAFGTFLLLLCIYIYFGMLPELLNMIQNWFVPNSSVDLSSATESFNQGLQQGSELAQGK